jgi:hypothetical protein
MKLSLREHDQELEEVQNRIALEKLALGQAVTRCTNSLRETVSSPKVLLGLAGAGFVIGKLMFGKKAPQQQATIPQKAGVLGLLTGLAGTAVSLMQPGLSGSIARWAAQRVFASKPEAPAASPTIRRTPAIPPNTPVTRRSEPVS